MHTISEQLFLVNNTESRLTIEPDSIVWSSLVGQPKRDKSSPSSTSSSSATAAEHDNSKKSHLTAATLAANRLSFAQIIGTNHTRRSNDKDKKKLKLYYAKQNGLKSTSQLLKIKSLTIESLKSTPPPFSSNKSLPTTEDGNHQRPTTGDSSLDTAGAGMTDLDVDQTSSEPPSCYASDGSSSHLSGSSVCSSPEQAPDGCGQDSATGGQLQSQVSLEQVGELIETRLERERQRGRPKRLLVFVNPYGGKGKAVRLYKMKVRRLLAIAGVETKLVITKHANHARDTIEDPMFNVEYFDAIICIGGDGMFSELMNGLLFRYNREQILAVKPFLGRRAGSPDEQQTVCDPDSCPTSQVGQRETSPVRGYSCDNDERQPKTIGEAFDLDSLRAALGGIGQPLVSPPLPIGVIGAGSTDANSFGLIGTNDVVTATLNIILGNQIRIDICSVHTIEEDRLLRFVSTFVAYGYFGDVVRESERLRWLGPSRYDVTGVNNLIKNRAYKGRVRILVSSEDGSPKDPRRCQTDCELCKQLKGVPLDSELRFLERRGSFVGVNAAVTACRCPQTRKGFSPNNHLANGCVDLILVRPCTRMQYVQYLLRTGWTRKSAFDLKYVEAYRCRQFEFLASTANQQDRLAARSLELSSNNSSSSSSALSSSSGSNSNSLESKIASPSSTPTNTITTTTTKTTTTRSALFSSWNIDGEILDEASIRVKVNNRLLRVFGTGEPKFGSAH